MLPDLVVERIDSVAVRDRFIGYLLAARAGVLEPPADTLVWGQLGRAALILGQRVAQFVEVTLPALLRQLNRVTEPERVELRGQVRGRIDWSLTHKSRLSQDNDPTLFVCRQVRRQYATLENELLKYVLETLRHLTEDVPVPLRRGVYWSPHLPGQPVPVQTTLVARYERLACCLNHVYLREIETPDRITDRHLLKARISKTEQYAEVADLYEAYVRLAVEARAPDLFQALRACVVLPDSLAGPGDDLVRLAAWAIYPPAGSKPAGG